MRARLWKLGWVLALALAAGCATGPRERPSEALAPDAGPGDASPKAEQRLPGEDVLATRPEPPPLQPFAAPVPAVRELSNGLRVYLVHRANTPLLAIRLVSRRGASSDPAHLAGLATLSAQMLEAGSAGKSQAEVARAVDAIGATLSVDADYDASEVAISALGTQLEPMVKLLADVALRPNLAAREFTKVQTNRLDELAAARAVPEAVADLAFRASLYGSHPLGRPYLGTPESVKRIRLGNVKAFLSGSSPRDAALVAVGGVEPEQVVAALERAFGQWKGGKPAAKSPAAAAVTAERPRLVVVDLPGRPQSVLRIGQPAVPRSSPDHLALAAMNTVLGGSFTSRLNANLREKHGFTYGARSRFAFGAGPGEFVVATSVKTEVTGAAVREAMAELTRIVDQELPAEDLEKAKALMAATLVQQLEMVDATAAAMTAIFIYDLPLDEFRTYVARLKALTPQTVQAATRRALQPGAMTITITGDASKAVPQLKAEPALSELPAPQRRDVNGAVVN